jgi:hypothetical protein
MRRNEIAKLPKNAEFGCGWFGVSFFHLCRVTELSLNFGLVSSRSGEKHTAKPVQVGAPQALFGSFDQFFRLPYGLKSFKDAIRKPQSFSLSARIVRHSCGLRSVSDSVRPRIAGGFNRVPSTFSSTGRSNRPNMRRTDSSGPSANQVW